MRAIPVTVTCSCGGTAALSPHAAVWTCPHCHLSYLTERPELAHLDHQLKMVKWLAWGGVLGILALVGALALVSPGILIMTPALLGAYYFLILPRYRARLRAIYDSLPEWQLRPQ
jgi:hypothetical protein